MHAHARTYTHTRTQTPFNLNQLILPPSWSTHLHFAAVNYLCFRCVRVCVRVCIWWVWGAGGSRWQLWQSVSGYQGRTSIPCFKPTSSVSFTGCSSCCCWLKTTLANITALTSHFYCDHAVCPPCACTQAKDMQRDNEEGGWGSMLCFTLHF